MDKAEIVFEKLGFPKVFKNFSSLAKQRKYILKAIDEMAKNPQVRTLAEKKRTKKALSLLMKINS